VALTAALAVMAPVAAAAQAACNNTLSGYTGGQVTWNTGTCTVARTATIDATSTALLATGAASGTLTNSGIIAGTTYGIYNAIGGSMAALKNGGLISGGSTGIYNAGTIGALTNSGTISGYYNGLYNDDSIGTLTNSGTISGRNDYGIANNGTIGTMTSNGNTGLDNSGVISGHYTGIYNTGTIGALTNSGAISGADYGGIENNTGGTIGTLTNSGTISGYTNGIGNTGGTIGALTNSGTISGYSNGIGNAGTIGALTNSGAINGYRNGISNTGTIIGVLNNGGAISGYTDGIYNTGMVGTLTNSGLITGSQYAIENDGTIGTITNSGVIAGNILNASGQNLNINGGSGAVFGTLTGFGGAIGTITDSGSNVTFGSGNLVLNDTINVGNGTGTVTNTAAALQVNDRIAIVGNYDQHAGATLLIGVANGAVTTGDRANDGGYGRLTASGSATIASGSSVTLQRNGGYIVPGQTFIVAEASSASTNYNAGSLNYSANGYSGVLAGQQVTANGLSDLVVTVDTATPQRAATTPNAVAALTALSHYNVNSTPAMLNVFEAADALGVGSSAAANRGGAQLSPVSQASLSQAAQAPTLDALNVVAAHSDSLRLAQTDDETGGTGAAASDWAMWGQAFGGYASRGTTDRADGYNANYGGLLFGVDKSLSDTWRAGGAFSFSNADIAGQDNSSGDATRVNSYGLIGYATYSAQSWYANFSAAAARQDYNTRRAIDLPGFSSAANGQFSGMQYVAQGEVGYPLTLGRTTLTPLAGLTVSRMNQHAYTETGGSGAALSVGASHTISIQSDIGANIDRPFVTSYGNVVPDLQIKWRHQYDNTHVLTNASFAADPSGLGSFSTLGVSPIANSAVLSTGVTLLRASNASVSARYELQAAPGFVSQAAIVHLRQVF